MQGTKPLHKSHTSDNDISSPRSTAGAGSEVLAQLAKRLSVVVDRIRGVPIGQELADIAQRIREEADCFASGTATDLLHTVAQLCQEREEMRHTFNHEIACAAERESTLKAECEALRKEKSPEAMRVELAVALQEEADAARAARSHLIAENEALRSELATERSTVRVLRAQLVGFQALLGTADAQSKHLCDVMPTESKVDKPNDSSLKTDTCDDLVAAVAPASSVDRDTIDCVPRVHGCAARSMSESLFRLKRSPRVSRHALQLTPRPPVRECQKSESYEPIRAHRALDFAGRDFVPQTLSQPPWRTEVAKLCSVDANLCD